MVISIHQLRRYFCNIDPGYFNLALAFKTVLVILISLWMVRDESTLIKVITGLAGGASMQGVITKSFMSRLIQLVVFDALYFAALGLGFTVSPFPFGAAIVLVVLGFGVNYIRRFGLDKSMAPMMVWVMCFLATILPVNGPTQTWLIINGVLIGFSVSACMTLFVFPDNYARLFVKNANLFFQSLAHGQFEMRRYVLTSIEPVNFEQLPFVSMKATLERLLFSNQSIQHSSLFAKDQKQISHVLMHQYALVTAYALMIDVYYSLWLNKHQLTRGESLAISQMHKAFANLFSSTKVGHDYLVSAQSANRYNLGLAEKLGKITLTDPLIIMALLNLKLGFDLLNQHERALIRGVDET